MMLQLLRSVSSNRPRLQTQGLADSTYRCYAGLTQGVKSKLEPEHIPGKKKKKAKGPKPVNRNKLTIKKVVKEGKGDDSSTVVAMLHSKDRKHRAQFTQQLTDFGRCLRPYIHDYMSDINNLLVETPNFLQERFIMVAFLGLKSIEELEDAKLVEKQVKYWLSMGKFTHAVHLCRMAKQNGSPGMARVAEYAEANLDPKLSLKVFRNMEKWGCKVPGLIAKFSNLTGQSLTGLLDPENSELRKIYETGLAETRNPAQKIILANSVLEILSQNSTVKNTFEFYYKIPNRGKFSRDYTTYSLILNYLASLPPTTDNINRMRDMVWSDIQTREKNGEIFVDSELVDANLRILMQQQTEDAYPEVLKVIDQYYWKDPSLDKFSTKFPFTSKQLDIVLTSMIEPNNRDDALALYDEITGYSQVTFTLENYHNFLRNYVLSRKDHTASALEIWNRLIEENITMTSATVYLVLRNFKAGSMDPNSPGRIIEAALDRQLKVDELIIGGYIDSVSTLYLSNRAPNSDVGLKTLQFVRENLNELKEPKVFYGNQKRVRRCLLKTSQLCNAIADHPDHRTFEKGPPPAWVNQLDKDCKKLLQTYSQLFDVQPGSSPSPQPNLTEQEIYHEKQKEISKRYRRLIEYHEVHINKPTIKALKDRLRATMRRTMIAPTVEKEYIKHDLP